MSSIMRHLANKMEKLYRKDIMAREKCGRDRAISIIRSLQHGTDKNGAVWTTDEAYEGWLRSQVETGRSSGLFDENGLFKGTYREYARTFIIQ